MAKTQREGIELKARIDDFFSSLQEKSWHMHQKIWHFCFKTAYSSVFDALLKVTMRHPC